MRVRALLTLAFIGLPTAALAHTGVGDTSGFLHGFMHPIGGIDHILAMVAVGVFAYVLGGRALWLVPLSFVGMMAVGFLLGIGQVDVPFVELSREIERLSGFGVKNIYDLYGQDAYRRYEYRALEEVIQLYPEAVIATPGGLVSAAATFNLLLSHCTTVWLRATPQDHMARVMAQGDSRPMSDSVEAERDLQRILDSRLPLYGRSDLSLDTSAQTLTETLSLLKALVLERTRTPGGA